MHTSSFKVKDFLQKEKIGKAADITFRFKRAYAWLLYHFDDVYSNKTKMWFIVTDHVSLRYFSPYHWTFLIEISIIYE